ncbi:MAG: hypothetical protein IPK22_09490 [Verrucomicrobiaceae bacterium]|nr:hypothetical protein [Verrucomicrobiaceae bacterium]
MGIKIDGFGGSPAALAGGTQIGLCQNEIVFWVVKKWVNDRAVLPESLLSGKKRFEAQPTSKSARKTQIEGQNPKIEASILRFL